MLKCITLKITIHFLYAKHSLHSFSFDYRVKSDLDRDALCYQMRAGYFMSLTCVKIKRLWKWSFTVIQKKTRLNQICVIRLWLFSLTKNKPSPTVWVLIMLSAHASMMHQAHFLSRRRRRIRTKPNAVIAMQADSPKMENGLKCLKAIVYYAFPVKYAILWMLCSSNGCRKHLSKCLVYILLWLYAIFTIKAKNATDCGALSKCSKLFVLFVKERI